MNELSIPDVTAATTVNPAAVAAMQRGAAGATDAAQAEKVAKDFESVLLHKLMETMQDTVPESGLLSNGITKQVQGIFWFHMAQELSSQGGLGLWQDIYKGIPRGDESAPAALEQQL